MQTALILMTILGCDDTATQCHYVEMLDRRWATIQTCDAEAGNRLKDYSNLDYPVVVAVCQSADDTGLAELAADEGGEPAAEPVAATDGVPVPPADVPEPVIAATSPEITMTEPALAATPETTEQAVDAPLAAAEPHPGLTARVLQRVQDVLPETASVKSLITEPVHFVTGSYSWVAQRFDK
ncbi:hypothetical protein OEG84_02970 [Hoeflea sp. G2-23]|uniref:Uncharacterized protein n=1 Tax=Hoeflea algicola TaxID=2983763 RepID=A0ABT3Z4X0_9HYPH|nr:hypothetical protein [Hoeflea algicola]MCY0146703.1 hypothetical protein [Hoeflea algicola]